MVCAVERVAPEVILALFAASVQAPEPIFRTDLLPEDQQVFKNVCLSLVHTSCRSQQLLQRATLLQIIGIFSIFTATVAGRSRFTISLNEHIICFKMYLSDSDGSMTNKNHVGSRAN